MDHRLEARTREGDAERLEQRLREHDVAAPALHALDEVEDERGRGRREIAGRPVEVGGEIELDRLPAELAERRGDGGRLVEHVLLVGGGIGRDPPVENDRPAVRQPIASGNRGSVRSRPSFPPGSG